MMRIGMVAAVAVWLAVAGANAGATQSSSPVAEALRAGVVGERYDGYLGFAATPSELVRRRVAAINIRRTALYTDLTTRRGVTRQMAGIATACELLSRVAVGHVYMLKDGVWRRRGPAEPPPSPEHCP